MTKQLPNQELDLAFAGRDRSRGAGAGHLYADRSF